MPDIELEPKRECDYFAGWISGVAGVIVVNPFDAIKTKQQTLDIGFKDGARTVKRLEGNLGFFRGLTLPLIVNGALNAMFFGMYGEVLDMLKIVREMNKDETQSQTPSSDKPRKSCDRSNDSDFVSKSVPHNIGKIAEEHQKKRCDTRDCLFAGAVAGLFQLIVACPVELVKVRQQAYGSIAGGSIQCISSIYSVKGFTGLYRGLAPMAWRNVGGGMIQRGVYTSLYDYNYANMQSEDNFTKWFHTWVTAGFAGMVSWWVVAPLDVIKTKIQADEYMSPKYTGLVNCANKVIASSGYMGLFRGVLSLSLPQFIVNGAVFLVYNWTDTLCRYQLS